MASRKTRDATRKRIASLDPTDPNYEDKRADAKRGKKAFVEPELIDLKS